MFYIVRYNPVLKHSTDISHFISAPYLMGILVSTLVVNRNTQSAFLYSKYIQANFAGFSTVEGH